MQTCELIIHDEVNVSVKGLDLTTRKKCVNALKYFVPYARYLPAVKLGRWDGSVSFMTIGGNTYINLLDRILPIIEQAEYEINVIDNRQKHHFEFDQIDENYLSNICWPKGHVNQDQPIILRDYQVEVVNNFLENLQSMSVVSTGSGKTIITAVLSKCVEKYGRTIVIVPSKDLVKQTEADYINVGLDVGVFFGDRKEFGRKHTICTWQSLNRFDKKSKDHITEISVDQFLDGVVCVIQDECHVLKAEEVRKVLTGPFSHVPIRWGLTGTIPEEEYNFMSLLLSIGPVVHDLQASELQSAGVLAKCHVNILQLIDNVSYNNYQEELKYLVTNDARLNQIAAIINGIIETGNTLILVDRIQTGEALNALLPNSVFISGQVKSADRKQEYDEVAVVDDKVIIATYGVASTGINIVRLFNLVLIEPGKSFIRVIQSIGRGLRKAPDKDHVEVWDISSTCKFSSRHLTKRKSFYKKAEYPFSLTKLKY